MADTIVLRGSSVVTNLEVAINGSGDKHFTHVQTAPSSSFTVTHGLGKVPAIAAYDSAGTRVFGNISNETTNAFTIDFGSLLFSGTIRCN